MGTLLESWWNIFFVGCFVLFVYILDVVIFRLRYFERRNIVHVKPDFKFIVKNGNHTTEELNTMYQKYPEDKYIGFYSLLLEPSYLIRDPELVNMITKTNFNNFHDRYLYGPDDEIDPLLTDLFNLTDNKWEELRSKLNPCFTANRMQLMFPLMQVCATSFAQQLRKINFTPDQDVDTKQLFSSVVFSTLASCGFGIEPEMIKDFDCEFRKMIHQSMTASNDGKPKFLKQTFPVLQSIFKSTPKEVEDYFINFTKKEMKKRRNQESQRQDFVELLLQIKDKGRIQDNCSDRFEDCGDQASTHHLDLSAGVLSSQMLMFYHHGYEQICKTISIVSYYLSQSPQMQERIRSQLRETKRDHRILNYPALEKITLLDYCILESLRIYPPIWFLKRVCTQDVLVSQDKVIEKGCTVIIPVMSLHNDPKYWSQPNIYDPKRFTRDELIPGTYLPFGQGPRACIGQRFVMLQTKIILAKLIENFQLHPSEKTCEPLKQGKGINSTVESKLDGLWVRLNAIDLSTV